MGFYEASGLTPAPATADQAFAVLWNPGPKRIVLREFSVVGATAVAGKIALRRVSARGTQTSTVAGARVDTMETAAQGTLDLAWSVQPTLTGNRLRSWHTPGTANHGFIYQWWVNGFVLASGVGACLFNPASVASSNFETYAIWEE